MRRLWLTILMAFALAANSAVASAMTVCPMRDQVMQAAAASAHDCCPDDDSSNSGGRGTGGDQSVIDCPFMQSCRTAPVISPAAKPVQAPLPVVILVEPLPSDGAPTPAPDDGLFRPPRNI